jgi:hypothetical protein
MARVVVVGHPAEQGPLPCTHFGDRLAQRLGALHLPFTHRAPTDRHLPADAERWVVSEPAGVFTEPVFRRAHTVVWLHFSPLTFARDWLQQLREQARRALRNAAGPSTGTSWRDITTALGYRLAATQLQSLFNHPALAHLKVLEFKTPEQAEFWLLMQKRRT